MQNTHFGVGCRIIVFLNRCAEQQQVTITVLSSKCGQTCAADHTSTSVVTCAEQQQVTIVGAYCP